MRNFANYDVDIHGKSSGVLKTICKKCLPTRKNKRDRSLRVNVDTGHCHCYHCGADFYVPDDVEERKNAERVAARKRRAAAIPQHFQRPVFDASKTTLSEDTERWLVETRCIPQSVIAALRITEQEEFMPQSGKKERCICFNYFEGEQLINTKFRALPKLFKMVQGAELIPYNIDSILGKPPASSTRGNWMLLLPSPPDSKAPSPCRPEPIRTSPGSTVLWRRTSRTWKKSSLPLMLILPESGCAMNSSTGWELNAAGW